MAVYVLQFQFIPRYLIINKNARKNFLKSRNCLPACAYCAVTIDDNAFLHQYQITEVPRFMVLPPNSYILSTKFPLRPTDNDFIGSLQQLLSRANVYYAVNYFNGK